MKWRRITLETTSDYEALIADMLCELGFDGIEISDSVPLSEADAAKMFIDIPPELDESDNSARVNCYIEMDADVNEKLSVIKNGLEDLSLFMDTSQVKVTVSETEDKDWMNNWKEFFKPFRVGEDILIMPTWESSDDIKPDDKVIKIDPGTAFGTGSHETTKLCMLALKKYLKKGDEVLDVGCGSGILSIAAKKFGAAKCLGTDIDENAVNVSYENAEVNGLETGDSLSFLCGNIISDAEFRTECGKYDVVAANILADIIMPLSDVISENMKQGAVFISSGILNTREKEVTDRLLSNGFDVMEVLRMGDWVGIVASKQKQEA